jgi:hypothetical protein
LIEELKIGVSNLEGDFDLCLDFGIWFFHVVAGGFGVVWILVLGIWSFHSVAR